MTDGTNLTAVWGCGGWLQVTCPADLDGGRGLFRFWLSPQDVSRLAAVLAAGPPPEPEGAGSKAIPIKRAGAHQRGTGV